MLAGGTPTPDPAISATMHDVAGRSEAGATLDPPGWDHTQDHARTPDQPLLLAGGQQIQVGKLFKLLSSKKIILPTSYYQENEN